ncbi:DUF1707 SHOCT-like domain-containing protein [Kribbella jiaozuonensis]|uniref:DUF1707 domain-containing protein n=1 Tax=Kribbella jiaozuonensis TaxID=2575441 RepID=A0A4U3LNB0_9ACTN|nr:DUF1707 domain-containing protein [Kribbella jiaozuonensis]TKK76614.1 DUF1707 domain-containing protein [Kribbella jiaozuonensis]
MTFVPGDRSPAIGDVDRDTAVRRVQEAYTDGILTHEEMDARLHQVLSARTRRDLELALKSLPAPDPGRSATIGAASGRISRVGVWRVPRKLKVHSAFGRVRLDLTRAIFEHQEVDIELKLGTGGAKIRVPRNAIVELEGLHTTWKDSQYKPPRGSTGTGPRIRISGAVGFGKVRIRHARW